MKRRTPDEIASSILGPQDRVGSAVRLSLGDNTFLLADLHRDISEAIQADRNETWRGLVKLARDLKSDLT